MTVSRLLLAGALLALSVAGAAAKPGLATSTVNLRQNPDTGAAILGKISGGAPLDVGECKDGWCAVTWNGTPGFAIATALDTTGRPLVRRPVRRAPRYYAAYPPPVYAPPPVYVAPYPYYSYYRRPYWGPRFYGPRFYGPRWGYYGRRW